MAYKSRKRLGRCQAAFGADGAVMAAATLAAAGMTTAAQALAAKQQADATRSAADAQAKSVAESAKINAQSIEKQNQVNEQNIQKQIDNQKETVENQNQILRDMNVNLALQAGRQNAEERAEANKIQVKYGGKLSKRKRLAYGGIDFNTGLEFEDKGYTIPLGNGLSLLQGGSPGNPQQQTHDNKHYNPVTGNNNTGMYFTTPEGRKIEAEGGIIGTNKPGEIFDKENNMILSQRHFLSGGYSPVEKILAGVPKEQVEAEQEITKQIKGLDSPTKAKYGMPTRLSTRQERKFLDWWGKKAPKDTNPDDYPVDYRRNFKPNRTLNFRHSLKNGGRIIAAFGDPYGYNTVPKFTIGQMYPNSGIGISISGNPNTINTSSAINPAAFAISTPQKTSSGSGSWWSRQSDATKSTITSAGINLLGTGISILGNNYASNILADANEYRTRVMNEASLQARDSMIAAYNQMHGVDIDSILNDSSFNAAHAIASIRSGRYNINPQLAQVERDSARQREEINRSTHSSAARRMLSRRLDADAYDMRSKLYGEQSNRVEAINQSNISELNKVANENADRDTEMVKFRGNLRGDLLKYNNDIENTKIQGIADANVAHIMGTAQNNAQLRLDNAGLRGNFLTNMGNQFGNTLANIGSTYLQNKQNYDNNQNALQIAAIASTNPNGVGQLAINNPSAYSVETLQTIYGLTDNSVIKDKLKNIIIKRGGKVA